ncbi:thioesterase family protein [Saccharomonospora saliphila]|uniref:thioesterase family protein n=1 Tax=Saccharomonospora saliphila TaxID=369829 RepID=UPI00037923F9|nr:thioesterase family protein [Saccharomonospora saliphila]
MTAVIDEGTVAAVKSLCSDTSTVPVRPRYEGNNICTWIGFKHVNYLVEEAVLEHFRNAGLSSRRLFTEFGLGVDIVELDTRILNAFHLDEAGTATVVPTAGADEDVLRFSVTIVREGSTTRDVTAKVRVALRVDTYLDEPVELPGELARFAVTRLAESEPGEPVSEADNTALADGRGASAGPDNDPVLARLTEGRNAFGWKWRIPYPYCHNNERLQMSGYLRQMEEVVDLFLADRGISIKTMLDERRWIPVVPHSSIEFLDEALMEEDLYTVYTVEEIFKDVTYRSRMDTYVVRDGRLVPTATGTITHGYAVIDDRRNWRLVNFDQRVLDALAGRGTRD